MITEALLDMIQGAASWLVGLLPVGTVDSGTGWGDLVSNLTALNYWLPIGEVAAVVIAVFALFPVVMGVSLAIWLVALIRGGSARG